jgi:tetratricopeptide (TPR) repeat protein
MPAIAVRAERHRWLGLELALGALLVFALGALVWYLRDGVLAEYHFRRMHAARMRGQRDAARYHLLALLQLPEDWVERVLPRARRWSRGHREWLAQRLLGRGGAGWGPVRNTGTPPPGRSADLALRISPDNRRAFLAKASAAHGGGNFQACVSWLRRSIKAARRRGGDATAREYLFLGEVLLRLDRLAEAEEAFRRGMEKTPKGGYAQKGLVECLRRRGRYRQAIRETSRLLAERPDAEEMLAERGECFALLGRHDLALRDFDSALARQEDPLERLSIRLERAVALGRLGRWEEANADFEKLLKVHPHSGTVLQARALAAQDSGRLARARADYREAILSDAGAAVLYNNLAWMLATAEDPAFGDPPEALRLARKAVDLDGGKRPYILDTLAEACYVNGLFDEAVRWETKALEKGGELYRDSLERFRAAAEAAREGGTVPLAASPLKDHHKPLAGDGGTTFDLSSLPAAPRRSQRGYMQAVFFAGRRGLRGPPGARGNAAPAPGEALSPFDRIFLRFARAWKAVPPAAVDDPREDMRMLARCFSPDSSPRQILPPRLGATVGFVRGFAAAFPSRDAGEDTLEPPGWGQTDTPLYVFGYRAALLLRELSAAELGNLFTRTATGEFRFSVFLPEARDLVALKASGEDGTVAESLRARLDDHWQRAVRAVRDAAAPRRTDGEGAPGK